jgi:hypothetical protein
MGPRLLRCDNGHGLPVGIAGRDRDTGALHLIRWSALLGEITPEDHLVVARTVRTRYLSVPGRLVNISGKPTLRAPREWPWAKKFERALHLLRALPPVPV